MCICQILSLATWEVFFFWHVETLLSVALASVHPTDCAGSEKEVLLVLPALYCIAVCGFVQVSCQGFLVREACVRVLVGGAVFLLSRVQ